MLAIEDDYLTLLKQKPLTLNEVNSYGGADTDNNHVNAYIFTSRGTALNPGKKGYGAIAYYSGPTCGYENEASSENNSGFINDYDQSDIKYVVDNWAADKFKNSELKEVDGYSARLIKFSDVSMYYPDCTTTMQYCSIVSTAPSWLYSYDYWTMIPSASSNTMAWAMGTEDIESDQAGGDMGGIRLFQPSEYVRPVINIYKSSL